MPSPIQKLIETGERRRKALEQVDLRIKIDKVLLDELKAFLSARNLEISATFRRIVDAILHHDPGMMMLIEEQKLEDQRTRKGPSLSKRERDAIYDALESSEE